MVRYGHMLVVHKLAEGKLSLNTYLYPYHRALIS